MARSSIAVAVLALAFLVTGTAAATAGRKLKQVNVGSNAQGFGNVQAGASNNAISFGNGGSNGGFAGGSAFGVSLDKNGNPVISSTVGDAFTLSQGGKSASQANVNAQNSGGAASGVKQTTYAGSVTPNGNAATNAFVKAAALGK